MNKSIFHQIYQKRKSWADNFEQAQVIERPLQRANYRAQHFAQQIR
jgi:hypothetical protein